MEMGKKIDKIISDMRALDPHLLCLQEADVNTKKANWLFGNGFRNMTSLFAVEVIMEGEGDFVDTRRECNIAIILMTEGITPFFVLASPNGEKTHCSSINSQ